MDGTSIESKPPFDTGKLDKLLDEAGIDALVVTSKHNIQYLLGGYQFFFFDQMDAIGISRYLPHPHLSKGPSGRLGLCRQRHGRLREGAR